MSPSPHYLGHRKRLKQKFIRDSRQLTDYELLELLLGYGLPRRDTKPLAKELLNRFGSLKGVLTARDHELRELDGFGSGLELFWKVWQEFWARIGEDTVRQRDALNGPKAVVEMAKTRIGFSSKESFWIVLVDNKNRLLSFNELGKGTVDQAPVYPREVFSLALKSEASGMILIHNHPGGDPKPSSQDIDFTKRLYKTASDLGIKILDHIIVAEESYFSFQGEGLI